MPADQPTSRLVAVLSADVANLDEVAAGDAAKSAAATALLREVLDGLLGEHHGTFAGAAGAVVRAEFVDVGDAVTAAVALQDALDAKRASAGMQVDARVGVAVGKVSGDPGAIEGPGVAMADGLREGTEPGGVRLSGAAYEQSRARMGDRFARVGRRPIAGEELFVYQLDIGSACGDDMMHRWGPHAWSHHAPGRHRSRDERRQWRAEFRARWREPQTPDERAQASVDRLKRFYRNAMAGAALVGFLFLVNVFSAPAHWWFVWPAIVIAGVLFLQAMRAVGPEGMGGEKWKHWAAERKYWSQQMEAEMRSRLSEAGADDRAIRRRLAAMRNFHRRATTFGVIALFLLCVNVITAPGHWWVVWPVLGMAFALAMNAIHVYGPDAMLGPDWEARKRAEMKAKFERE